MASEKYIKASEVVHLVTEGDNRTVATTPNDYSNKLIFKGLKQNEILNLEGTTIGTYSFLFGLRGWSDSSGGNSHELAFNNGGIFTRKGATTEWNNWQQLATGNTRLFKGTCSTAAATTAKTVVCPEFKSSDLVKGAIIFVTFDYTNSGAVASITMNVNGTGAKNIKKQYNTTAASNLTAAGELIANYTYMFQYDGTNWICMTLDYNNTYTQGNNLIYYERNYLANASNPLYRYKLYGYNELGKVVPITITNQTSTTIVSKTPTSLGIKASRGICYYSSTIAVTSTSTVLDAQICFSSYAVSAPMYTFNANIPEYCDIYLKGTYDAETDLFYLDTSSNTAFYVYASRAATATYATYIQKFVAGYYYMFVGSSYSSANHFQLREDNPLYYFDGTNLILATSNISQNGTADEQYYLVGNSVDNAATLYRYETNGPYMIGAQVYAGSDLAYKKDITPISDDFVNQLFDRTDITYDFKWKDTNKDSSGFIAQWIEDIMPEMVNGIDGDKHVNYDAALSKVVGAMFKKIQEQQKEIDELKTIIKQKGEA